MSRLTDAYKAFSEGREKRDADRAAVGLPTSTEVLRAATGLLVRDPRQRRPTKTITTTASSEPTSSGLGLAVGVLALVGFVAFGGKKAMS